ncbi:MAG: EAL domain-containing protein [Lachnospiraceae bacterium]|nr:EAL domain-containing protein [Lachnospiraceae bacterium]
MERYEFNKESRELLESSVIPFAIYQFIDKRVVALIISDGFCKLFHFKDKSQAYNAMDNNMYHTTYPSDIARISEAAYRFASVGGKYDIVYRTKRADGGDYIMVHAIGEHFTTDTGVKLAQVWYTDEGAYYSDDANTDELRKALKDSIKRGSNMKTGLYDHLTGLPTMTCFFEMAETGCNRILKDGGIPAILFFDLSGMKSFNRRHGFVEGDNQLIAFARLLERHFTNGNCSRFVQDHFVVYTEKDSVEEKIQAIFDEWKECCHMQALPVRVGVFIKDSNDVDIITASDNAKVASDMIRNTFVSCIRYYNQELQEDMEKRDYIISNIDRAISEKWIKVYYQPIVRAVNGKVCDEEALARWIDPVKGFMSPADFIGVLEEAHLIYKLDLYVVDQIIEKLSIIKKAGLFAVPQSVNLSRSDFEECDIVDEILKRVDKAGIDHSLLTIEITESMVAADFEYMRSQVNRFRELGFQVWMDDFGSGYSSLDVLQDLDLDLIKFDMRFLQQMEDGVNSKVILTELMRMATALGLETVCEGVETKEHVEFLSEIGCCKLQGYYYTKPLPLEQILERYEQGRQIGFENPDETTYYDTLGSINLYDLDWVVGSDSIKADNFFDSIPMVIMELTDDAVRIVRSNTTYKEFSDRSLERNIGKEFEKFDTIPEHHRKNFLSYMIQCANNGGRVSVDERLPNSNTTIHTIMKRVAVNPVKGTRSVAVAVLAVTDDTEGITYASIANSLAGDYFSLYYVDVKTDEYIRYSPDRTNGMADEKQRGKNFFKEGCKESIKILYKSDRADFVENFNKENILKELDEQGRFAMTYRIIKNGKPEYVSMKAMPMSDDTDHIIVGLSNVDAQMKQRETLERLKREQIVSARLGALVGNYLCIYTVNLENETYFEFGLNSSGHSLGFGKEGVDFFNRCLEEGKRIIHKDDYDSFIKVFNKNTILRTIKKDGVYTITYRICVFGKTFFATLRAAIVNETDGDKLIVGLYKEDKVEEENEDL